MTDTRKPADEAIACGEKHGRDLRRVNDGLRDLIASLRSDMERMSGSPRTGPAPQACAAATPQGGAPIDLESRRVAAELAQAREAVQRAEDERERLLARLAEIEAENRRVCDEFVQVQEQNTELAQLHVALERIHGGASRAETLAAVQDVVVNLVGSEELAVLERRRDGLEVALSVGVDPERLREVRMGRGAIGRTAATGIPYLAGKDGPPAPEDADLTACIPLKAGGETVAVVAIFRLLCHKRGLGESDHALFDLLAAHAGVALRLREPRDDASRP